MFDKIWKIAVGLSIISLVVGLASYYLGDFRRREMTELTRQVADSVVGDFKQALPKQRSINRMLVVIVERSSRDEEVELREKLLDAIQESDKYNVVTWAKAEKVLKGNELNKWRVKFGFNDPSAKPVTVEQAVDAMRRLDKANFAIEGVLFVEITNFSEGDDTGFGTKIGLKGTIWDREKELATVGPVKESIDSRTDLRYLSHAMSTQNLFVRFVGWLLLACGLPWALIVVVRAVIKRKSNGANIGLLVGFTLFDVVLAWVLLMAFGTGTFTILGLIVIAALMGYYNYDAMDYIERRLL